MTQFTRRQALRLSAAGATVLVGSEHASASDVPKGDAWRLGLIADLHFGLAPDALARLEKFMLDVEQESPACIMQLGDFNYGTDANECMQLWRQFKGQKLHVLGNHDMDKRGKAAMCDYWEMPAPYYSMDLNGWHVVVLDRNHLKVDQDQYVDYEKANFYVASEMRGFADPEQLEWLRNDLKQTDLPTVVFAHQGLGIATKKTPHPASVAIERVLAEANRASGKVKACFCGHHHIDRHQFRDGLHYVWINSASYYWVGGNYGRMAPFTEPLYTYLTFRPDQSIEIRGCQSAWATPSPEERGYPEWEKLNTHIEARTLA